MTKPDSAVNFRIHLWGLSKLTVAALVDADLNCYVIYSRWMQYWYSFLSRGVVDWG